MGTKKPTLDDIKNEINSTWFWYKVCEGCDTVALYEVTFCPKCRGYHFNENRKRVIDEIIKRYEEKFKRNNGLELKEYSDLSSD